MNINDFKRKMLAAPSADVYLVEIAVAAAGEEFNLAVNDCLARPEGAKAL